jgi:hypothetical protein
MKAIAKKDKPLPVSERIIVLQSLAQLANRNPKKLEALQTYLNENPDLCDKISLLANSVKSSLLEKIVEDAGSRLLIREELDQLKKRLTNEESTPLERLLIDAVLMCWLRFQQAESYRNSVMGAGHTFTHVEYADKMLTRTHNRYLKAIESLARLRRLNQPKPGNSMDRSLKAVRLMKALSSS